jgi:hypothetical protein
VRHRAGAVWRGLRAHQQHQSTTAILFLWTGAFGWIVRAHQHPQSSSPTGLPRWRGVVGWRMRPVERAIAVRGRAIDSTDHPVSSRADWLGHADQNRDL